jgi:thiol-disulfide isomerase/thioredoxin
MKKFFRLVIAIFDLMICLSHTSCSSPLTDNEVKIIGRVKNLETDKVYLVKVVTKEILDSSVVLNGNFEFKFKPDSAFEPFMIYCYYFNSRKQKRVLLYQNHYSPKKGGTNAFMFEVGVTNINGTITDTASIGTNPLEIKACKETEVMYSLMYDDFGNIADTSAVQHAKKLSETKSIIKKYPWSNVLLQKIFNQKVNFSDSELDEILVLFDEKLKQSKYFQSLIEYKLIQSNGNIPYGNLTGNNIDGIETTILSSRRQLKMLVFWASWCGPCLKEIPSIMQIERDFKNDGLEIVSLSIDTDTTKWKEALKKEQMTWPQIIVSKENAEKIKYSFKVSSIPVIFIFGPENKIIKRYDGFDDENMKNARKYFAEYYKK